MPLFRSLRGSLDESLKTTVIVKTHEDLIKNINKYPFLIQNESYEIKIDDYCFDDRIGWYTQIVLANIFEKDKFHPVGFLSEPF